MNSRLGYGTTGEGGSLFVTPQLFDRILASDQTLIAIDTPRPDEILVQFRQFALRSGSSIYAWNDLDGITSLREGEVSVAGSARLPEALRYINASPQFGVYLFPGLSTTLRFSPLRAPALAQLRQIARNRGSTAVRKVVLIDAQVALDDTIDEQLARFPDQPVEATRLRLRDGRWVS